VSSGFDDLSEQFSQDELLCEVLGPNHNPIRMTFTTCDRQKKQKNEDCADDQFSSSADGVNSHES
jgi:hypothetical protein